jgi:L-ascorbate metabolism protein UlaG (beta-lactamase superfamily)
MFDIEYKGGNSVIITTKSLKLVADPKVSLIGLKDVSVKDAVVIATESRFLGDTADARLVIEGPGEYEVGDFSIQGIPATRQIDTGGFGTTVYRLTVGEARIALFGNIAGDLDEDQLEAIGVVDIVIVPVGGGGYTLDAVKAARLIRSVDPKVVIPIHYSEAGMSYEVPQDPLKLFTDELGAPIETVDKYKIKSVAALPPVITVVEVKRT